MSQPIPKRTIVRETISSQVLGKERPLRIFLPPNYNEMFDYPVVYCQDGEEAFNFGRVATIASQLIAEDAIVPPIIVGVDVDMPNRTAEYSPDGERFDSYRTFFMEEMLPYVEQHFSVRKDPLERILLGDSLGGTVSLHLALLHPDISSRVISLSGAFFSSTEAHLEKEQDLSWLEIYQLIGLDETDVKTDRGVFDFLQLNRRTKEQLTSLNARVTYIEKPGKHIWGFWQKEIPEALTHFLG